MYSSLVPKTRKMRHLEKKKIPALDSNHFWQVVQCFLILVRFITNGNKDQKHVYFQISYYNARYQADQNDPEINAKLYNGIMDHKESLTDYLNLFKGK